MAGIMSMPTAAVVAGPEPEMAPKKTQDSVVEMARPPGVGPTMFSATFTSRLETPAASMSDPARTKAGSAMSGKAVSEAKARSIIRLRSMSSTMKQVMVATPSATMIGLPMSSSTKKIANSIKPMLPGERASITPCLLFLLPP